MTPSTGSICVLAHRDDLATVEEISRTLCRRTIVEPTDLPETPWSLASRSLVAVCDPTGGDGLADVVEAALRGVDVVLAAEVQPPARWIDALDRVSSILDWRDAPHVGLAPIDVTLLARLQRGETIADAAVACTVSERTASRRLLSVRAALDARSNAEAMIVFDAAVRPWVDRA